ncbi:putative uridine kinase C227.14 isoform X1 [Curcuma longa]|uniref:putative uridine kinase C227.14 isoform X1 n=1 Tax=Curcuma longa TaxID=136217 RepID=UPI003D9EEDAB
MESSVFSVSSSPGLRCSRPGSVIVYRNHVTCHHFLNSTSLASRGNMKLILGQTSIFTQKQKNQKVLLYQKKEAPILAESRSIEKVYESLAERLGSSLGKVQGLNSKYIVGLAGPPGAGKTTLASEVACRLNKLWSKSVVEIGEEASPHEVVVVLPMDGFHLYRSQLDAMDNPKEAHARRGAPWTFNPELLLKCLHALRKEGQTYAPSFDHGVGDPIEDDVFIRPEHKIVIVEGNYLFLEEGMWQDICSIFDEKWFIDIDIDVSMKRVLKRHISTGKEPDVAKWRIEYNDRPNAELIMRSKKNADLVIRSVDF